MAEVIIEPDKASGCYRILIDGTDVSHAVTHVSMELDAKERRPCIVLTIPAAILKFKDSDPDLRKALKKLEEVEDAD